MEPQRDDRPIVHPMVQPATATSTSRPSSSSTAAASTSTEPAQSHIRRLSGSSPAPGSPYARRHLWRLLYETAARAGELLALDVEDLDQPNKRARIRSKGGDLELVHYASGSAQLLPRLIAGRRHGPVFLTARCRTARDTHARYLPGHRPSSALLSARRSDLHRAKRRMDAASASALRAHPLGRAGRLDHAPDGEEPPPIATQPRALRTPRRRCRRSTHRRARPRQETPVTIDVGAVPTVQIGFDRLLRSPEQFSPRLALGPDAHRSQTRRAVQTAPHRRLTKRSRRSSASMAAAGQLLLADGHHRAAAYEQLPQLFRTFPVKILDALRRAKRRRPTRMRWRSRLPPRRRSRSAARRNARPSCGCSRNVPTTRAARSRDSSASPRTPSSHAAMSAVFN